MDQPAFHNRSLTQTKADQGLGQDYDGRLWDVLWLAAFTIKLADPSTDTVNFTVALRETDDQSGGPQTTEFHISEPVVTIGFPEDF